MFNFDLQKLLKTEMSRKEFLTLGGLVVASLFGVVGLIRELSSRAAASTADIEPEDGTLAGGAAVTTDATASGGNGVKFGSVAAGTTTWLPFNMPNWSTLASKLTDTSNGVFIHSFSPLMPNFNNSTANIEYPYTNYMPPGRIVTTTDANGNKIKIDETVYGGQGRDWSPWRSPSNKTSLVTLMDGESTIYLWQLEDYMSQVEAARKAGVDGFFISVQVVEKGHTEWERSAGMVEAINRVNAAHPGERKFWAILRHDGAAGGTSTTQKLIDSYTWMWNQPCAYKTADGKLLVSPLSVEVTPNRTLTNQPTTGVNFYTTVKNSMAAAGKPISIWPVFVSTWDANAPSFNPITDGFGRWGDRGAEAVIAETRNNRGAAAYCHTTFSKPWMAAVAVQDFRPRDRKFWEAWGFGTLVGSWQAALQAGNSRANWVNIPTLNDFLEGSQIGPSVKNGNDRSYSPWLDVSAYFLTWFKMGTEPTVVRDAIYLAHRLQLATGATAGDPGGGTTITGGTVVDEGVTKTVKQTEFAVLGSGNVIHDDVDVLVFATSAATIEVTIGGVLVKTASVVVGINQIKAPARLGTVSAVMKRSGLVVSGTSVTSPHKIVSSLVSQDLTYYACSSLR